MLHVVLNSGSGNAAFSWCGEVGGWGSQKTLGSMLLEGPDPSPQTGKLYSVSLIQLHFCNEPPIPPGGRNVS